MDWFLYSLISVTILCQNHTVLNILKLCNYFEIGCKMHSLLFFSLKISFSGVFCASYKFYNSCILDGYLEDVLIAKDLKFE